MPSATPRRDISVGWRAHTCGAAHPTAAACPRLGYWLISGQPVDGGQGATVTPILHGKRPDARR